MASESHCSTLTLSSDATRDYLMIILLADTPLPPVKSVYGDYHDIFTAMFRNSLSSRNAEQGSHKLTIESYDVVQLEYPPDDRLKQADAVLITGSASSAYESKPWIDKLVEYTADIQQKSPSTKIFGICFGHQIIARAFGKRVEKNAKGWEIGVRQIDLTPLGKRIFDREQSTTIHQMHQDHVPEIPDGFELLGSTPACPIHGMAKMQGDKASILTMQGHPEFTSDIVNKIIDIREQRGVITAQIAQESRQYAAQRDDGIRIGSLLLNHMMQ